MSKIKITLKRENISVMARLRDDISPLTCSAFEKVLPVSGKTMHARWCGDEIWTSVKGMGEYQKESETILPNKGELLLIPSGENNNHLTLWYGRGWCISPKGFEPGNVLAQIEGDFEEFAKACNGVLVNGMDEILIEKV